MSLAPFYPRQLIFGQYLLMCILRHHDRRGKDGGGGNKKEVFMEPLVLEHTLEPQGCSATGHLGKALPMINLNESFSRGKHSFPPLCLHVPRLPPMERNPVVKNRTQPDPSCHIFRGRTLGTSEIIFTHHKKNDTFF